MLRNNLLHLIPKATHDPTSNTGDTRISDVLPEVTPYPNGDEDSDHLLADDAVEVRWEAFS